MNSVQKALDEGVLDHDRWLSYLKLQRELKYLARRVDVNAARKEKERWKKISKNAKIIIKQKRGRST